MRPQASVDFPSFSEPVLFFGDETSLAAAQTLNQCEKPRTSRFVFEVTSPDQAERVLRGLSIADPELIQKNRDGSHVPLVVSKLVEQAGLMKSRQWVFTGQAQSIQSIRKGLNHAGVSLSVAFAGIPLGCAAFMVYCLLSSRRTLTGLIFSALVLGIVLVVRIYGMEVDSSVQQSMGLVKAEIVLVAIMLVGIATEMGHQSYMRRTMLIASAPSLT